MLQTLWLLVRNLKNLEVQRCCRICFNSSKESDIRKALIDFANKDKQERPEQWQSCIHYDCSLVLDLINYTTLESLSEFRPFGFGFSEPIFLIKGKVSAKFLINKNTGEQKHTSLSIERKDLPDIRIIFLMMYFMIFNMA